MVRRRGLDSRINLSSNELLHPRVDELLEESISELKSWHLGRYPSSRALVEDIGSLLGIPTNEFLLAPGSDAAIRAICIAHKAAFAGSILLLQHPNYVAWEQMSRPMGLDAQLIKGNSRQQEEALIRAASQYAGCLIAISVPNGPTGSVLRQDVVDELSRLSSERGHTLVIDGCYQAFLGDFHQQLTRRSDHVVVVQSLSKSHGLAGVRCAIVAASESKLAQLSFLHLEESVSAPTLVTSRSMLRSQSTLLALWDELNDIRMEVATFVLELGMTAFRSGGNFVTFDAGSIQRATEIQDAMSEAGYRIRNLSDVERYEGCLRITVAASDIMDGALVALARSCARSS